MISYLFFPFNFTGSIFINLLGWLHVHYFYSMNDSINKHCYDITTHR